MTTTQMTSSFPWDELSAPRGRGEFVTQFIPQDDNPKRRPVFWARSWRNQPALLVEYDAASWTRATLPSFKNILVQETGQEAQDKGTLAIELMDPNREANELFFKVCIDIVETLQKVPADETRLACIYRLERWSAFLKASRPKLTGEQQKGLIAELRFLQRDMIGVHGPSGALMGWTGPERDARDFLLRTSLRRGQIEA